MKEAFIAFIVILALLIGMGAIFSEQPAPPATPPGVETTLDPTPSP